MGSFLWEDGKGLDRASPLSGLSPPVLSATSLFVAPLVASLRAYWVGLLGNRRWTKCSRTHLGMKPVQVGTDPETTWGPWWPSSSRSAQWATPSPALSFGPLFLPASCGLPALVLLTGPDFTTSEPDVTSECTYPTLPFSFFLIKYIF